MVIKNFLGHTSILTTQIYAEISQETVDRNLKEWNQKWFDESNFKDKIDTYDKLPIFLMP